MSTDPFTLVERIRLREALANDIERMIALLDQMDGDPDLEPSLGCQGQGVPYDAEADDSDLEASGDELEPSLGSVASHQLHSQEFWAAGSRSDCEEDVGDEGEPDVDGEPSLGWPDRMINQEHLRTADYMGGDDRELDRCDYEDAGDTESNGDELDYSDHSSGKDGGIGDLEGLHEQMVGYGHGLAYQ